MLHFFTHFRVPRIDGNCYSMIKGECLVIGLEMSTASIIMKRGKFEDDVELV